MRWQASFVLIVAMASGCAEDGDGDSDATGATSASFSTGGESSGTTEDGSADSSGGDASTSSGGSTGTEETTSGGTTTDGTTGGSGDPGTTGSVDCSQMLADGSFEGGSAASSWSEHSDNFSTVICSQASCNVVSGATDGQWWLYFAAAADAIENAWAEQTVTLPSPGAELRFDLHMGTLNSGAVTDTLMLTIDGQEVWGIDDSDATLYTPPTVISVDLSAWADDAPHTIRFATTIENRTNFNIDAVVIDAC